MQNQIQIPVSFEFETAKRSSWAAGTAWIWGWDGYDFATTVRVEGTDEERQFTFERNDLPAELRDKCDKALSHDADAATVLVHGGTTSSVRVWDESVQNICSGFPLELLIWNPDWPDTKADPWTMREEFLHTEPDTKSILHFLNRWGTWDHKGYLRVSEFLAFQQLVRGALPYTPEQWFKKSHNDPFDRLVRQAKYPYFAIHTSGCREAILATITVNKLRGTRFTKCAREDCPNPFEITRPDRTYCCQYCAHLESTRRKARNKKSRRKNR